MADAEIIPIGAAGRAGRGSRTSPSAAARALAPQRAATSATPRSAKTRGAKTQSAKTQSAKTQGAKTRGAKTQSAKTRGAKTQSAKTRGAKTQGAKTQGAKTPMELDDIAEALTDAAREVFGPTGWERRLAELFSFLRHRITGDYQVDEFGFDAEVTERFVLSALRPLAERWFRVEVRGIDNIPAEGGALVVSNHSGTLPVDGLITMLVLHDHAHRSLRALGADLVFKTPFIGELARKGGATLASNDDAERMLARGDLVGVWPEGFKGIGKPFSERYKLQRFGRGGFVSAALRVGVPIIPCSVVGAEEIYPMIGNVRSLARLLGVPYVPVTPLFPWFGILGALPLPSKWLIEFGEPIRTDTFGRGAADDPMLVFNVTDQVRETIQQTLYTLLIRRRGVFG